MKEEAQNFPSSEIKKITAIWAFSESILGGILHAFRIPFTGLLLGGLAIIFLYLISEKSKNKIQIIQSTLVVTSIKFLLSPNTPLTAHVAVLFQGFVAYLIFSILGTKKISVFILSFVSMLYSSAQKIILTTVIFGFTFWHSIDDFTNYVMKSFGVSMFENISMSIILILIYFLLHLIGAVFFAFVALKIQDYIKKQSNRYNSMIQHHKFNENSGGNFLLLNNKKKKKWYHKPTRILLIVFFICLASITLLDPELKKITFLNVLSMIVRALIIIYLWFNVISPFLINQLKKFLIRSKSNSAENINELTNLFDEFKKLIQIAWIENSDRKSVQRIVYFLKDSLMLLLN